MIEDYLGNHITPEERQEVERMANEDPELAKQIAEQRLLIATLQEQGRRQNEAFAAKMKAIPRDEMEKFIASKRRGAQKEQNRETEKKEEKKRSKFFKGWAVRTMAAAAALLGVFLGFNLFYHSSGAPNYTAEQQAEISDLNTQIFMPTRGGGSEDLNKAIELVRNDDEGKHKQGIEALEDIFNNPDTEDTRLHAGECLAIALIADGKLADAEKIVDKIKDAQYYDELKKLINNLK